MKPPPTPAAAVPRPGSELFWTVWSIVAAFGTYFCMYFYRKPFTVETFQEDVAFGLALKPVVVTAQMFGYMLSKFIGIKVIAELPPERRVAGIAVLISIAQAALVGFGLVPTPWNVAFLFLNGLALGMVFGMVLGFLEGRQQTEALTAGLCASFILAGGMTKSVGKWLLGLGISRFWMPSAAGALFIVPLAVCLWMLSRIPPPNVADIAARSARPPLNRSDRLSLLSRYAVGLIALVIVYLTVSILRTIRDDFAAEIWRDLGYQAAPGTFTYSEMWVAAGVLAATGAAVFIRNNCRAFFTALGTCAAGFVLLAAALVGRQQGQLGDFPFMVLTGLGLYLPYVAFHTTIFERLLAMTRARGNIGFLMYVVDSIGYLGSVVVILVFSTQKTQLNFVFLFLLACWLAVGISSVCLALCWRYFAVRVAPAAATPAVEPAT